MELPQDLFEYIIRNIVNKDNYAKLCLISHQVKDIVLDERIFEYGLNEMFTDSRNNLGRHQIFSGSFADICFNIPCPRSIYINIKHDSNRDVISYIEWKFDKLHCFKYETPESACVWINRIIGYLWQLYPRFMKLAQLETNVVCLCDECCQQMRLHWNGFNDHFPTPRFLSLEIVESDSPFMNVLVSNDCDIYRVEYKLKREVTNIGYVMHKNKRWSPICIPIDGEYIYVYPMGMNGIGYSCEGNYHWVLDQMLNDIYPNATTSAATYDLSDMLGDIVREIVTKFIQLPRGYQIACLTSKSWCKYARSILQDNISKVINYVINDEDEVGFMLPECIHVKKTIDNFYEVIFNNGMIKWDLSVNPGLNLHFTYKTKDHAHVWLEKAIEWMRQLFNVHSKIIPRLTSNEISGYCMCKKCFTCAKMYPTPNIISINPNTIYKKSQHNDNRVVVYYVAFRFQDPIMHVGYVKFDPEMRNDKWSRIYNIDNGYGDYITINGNYQWLLTQMHEIKSH